MKADFSLFVRPRRLARALGRPGFRLRPRLPRRERPRRRRRTASRTCLCRSFRMWMVYLGAEMFLALHCYLANSKGRKD